MDTGTEPTGWRQSGSLASVAVTLAFILDAVLSTAIVPLLPALDPNVPLQYGVPFSLFTVDYGLVLALKPLFELIATPLFGMVTNRFGYSVSMLIGFVGTLASTLLYAYFDNYLLLCAARSLHGFGSAALLAPGIGLLAERFPDEEGRARATAIAFGGMSFGVLVGPVFGGFMFDWYRQKKIVFLALAAATVVDGCLRALIVAPRPVQKEESSSVKELLTDPYLLVVMGGLFVANLGSSMLEALMPAWMADWLTASSAVRGLAFVPLVLGMVVTSTLCGCCSGISSHLRAIFGLIVAGLSLSVMPLVISNVELAIPVAVLGAGIGLVGSSLLPLLAYLVETRHKSAHGTVYAINRSVFCVSYLVATIGGGILNMIIRLLWTLTLTGIVTVAYSPLLCFVRAPGTLEEQKPLRGIASQTM